MIRGLFIRQVANSACVPVHHCNVRRRRGLRLVVQGDQGSARRPLGTRFRDLVGLGQIDDFAAVRGHRIEIIDFSATFVGLKQNPLSVGRPHCTQLSVVRLAQLNWPTAARIHFPEIHSTGEVAGEHNLLTVRRPRTAADRAGVEEIVDRYRTRTRHLRGYDFLRVGNLACVRGTGCTQDCCHCQHRQ